MNPAGPSNDFPGEDAPAQMGLPFDDFGPEEFELLPLEDEVEATGLAGRESRVRTAAETWAAAFWPRFAWLGLAVVLALGSAGLVAAASPPPTSGGREELTYAADSALTGRLDAAVAELKLLDDDVTTLADRSRDLLAYTTQVNQPALETTYKAGADALTRIANRSNDLSTQLDCQPWTAARTSELELTYSPSLVARWHQVCQAVESLPSLSDNWSGLVNGSQLAVSVANAIAGHDSLATEALQLATQARYADALTKLNQADDSLSGAQQVADSFSAVGRDVSTLSDWLDRINGMDIALRALWQAMIDSNGRVTLQVTAALKAVNDAKALLPDSNAVLSIAIYELAGDLTGEAVTIELARGELGAAVADLTGTVVTQ